MSAQLLPGNICLQSMMVQLLVHDLRHAMKDDTVSRADLQPIMTKLVQEAARLQAQTHALMSLLPN